MAPLRVVEGGWAGWTGLFVSVDVFVYVRWLVFYLLIDCYYLDLIHPFIYLFITRFTTSFNTTSIYRPINKANKLTDVIE